MSIIQKCIYFFKISFENQINQFDRFGYENCALLRYRYLLFFKTNLFGFICYTVLT